MTELETALDQIRALTRAHESLRSYVMAVAKWEPKGCDDMPPGGVVPYCSTCETRHFAINGCRGCGGLDGSVGDPGPSSIESWMLCPRCAEAFTPAGSSVVNATLGPSELSPVRAALGPMTSRLAGDVSPSGLTQCQCGCDIALGQCGPVGMPGPIGPNADGSPGETEEEHRKLWDEAIAHNERYLETHGGRRLTGIG
jgi:hypothetical protein